MSSEEPTQKSFSRATRVPLEAVVRLHFEGEVSYQNGFSANLSATGMFVKHPEPHPVGSRLVFECLVGLQRRPVQGIGQVVWARPRYEGPGLPAGMGIEFLEVDPRSREHLAQALFEYLEESLGGQTAAETEAEESPAAPAAEPFRLALDGAAAEEDELEPHEEAPAAAALAGLEAEEWDTSPARALDEAPDRAPEPSWTPEPPSPAAGEPAPDSFATPWESAAPLPPPEAPAEAWRLPEATPWTPDRPAWSGEPAAGGGEGERYEEMEELAPPARSRRGWLWGGLAALLLLGLAGAAWLWWPAGSRVASQEAAATAAPVGGTGSPPAAAEPAASPEARATPAVAAATPPPAAAPSVTPEPAPAVPLARFGGVRELRWETTGGGTEVAVLLDGSIAQGDWSFASMPGENPRLLLKLRGVTRPYRPNRVEVGTAEVRAVRLGLHAGARGDEQHLVLDLGRCDPRRATVRAEVDRLLVLCPGG